ncbi:TetR/AcrR family transcriptional regulator [Microlunatus speluncae]|uniref:TetR/AcrR family transcriptional regulator n=1 Tax=Microlunatus speluncae TaxID=2594267 RepID=UPI0012667263|nr:TetR/AcrR family transcriptional regulator [Microlunatus speluncae]
MRTNRDSAETFTETARRAQIVDCAIRVVSRHGYAGASLSRVAELAGISKGVITYHFASKAEILEAAVAEVFARGAEYARTHWADVLADEAEPRQLLRGYLESNLGYIAAHPEQINAVVEIIRGHRSADGSPVFGSDWEERETFGLLEQIFRAGQEAGQFREFSPRVMAIAVRRVIDGFSFQVLAHPQLDVAAFTAEVVELFDRATRREGSA